MTLGFGERIRIEMQEQDGRLVTLADLKRRQAYLAREVRKLKKLGKTAPAVDQVNLEAKE